MHHFRRKILKYFKSPSQTPYRLEKRFVSDIAIFVLKRDVKLQLTDWKRDTRRWLPQDSRLIFWVHVSSVLHCGFAFQVGKYDRWSIPCWHFSQGY